MIDEDHYDTPWEFLARPTSVRLSTADIRQSVVNRSPGKHIQLKQPDLSFRFTAAAGFAVFLSPAGAAGQFTGRVP